LLTVSELNRYDSLLSQQMGDVQIINEQQSLKGLSQEKTIKGDNSCN